VYQETPAHGADYPADAHGGAGFPPFDQLGDYGVSQIFWLVVTFGGLYFVLSRVFLPKIEKAISDRESTIAADISEAAALSQKADGAVKAFEQRINEARSRARQTADEARKAADARIAEETARVEAELARKLADAEKRVADVRAAAMANVAVVAEGATTEIVEKLSGVHPDAATVKRAVAAMAGGA
jgi:F-type H+-transporting ATPase subunit b